MKPSIQKSIMCLGSWAIADNLFLPFFLCLWVALEKIIDMMIISFRGFSRRVHCIVLLSCNFPMIHLVIWVEKNKTFLWGMAWLRHMGGCFMLQTGWLWLAIEAELYPFWKIKGSLRQGSYDWRWIFFVGWLECLSWQHNEKRELFKEKFPWP